MAKPSWKCITKHENLQRSSHVVCVVGDETYIFGGELVPREPRDNQVYVVDHSSSNQLVDVQKCTVATAPSPRVGSASTSINDQIYIFSGRGGAAMKPIEEQGGLWSFEPAALTWSLITPKNTSAPFPPARSYHCMTSDRVDTIFVHAGCPNSGRLLDLWSFSLRDRKWVQLSDAPAPARGGASIAYSNGNVYRMNGFDGKTEQGGSLDVFHVASKVWTSRTYVADGISGPEARSVGTLLALEVEGKEMLVTLFGERDPSNLGHAGAGKMLGDAWLYEIAGDTWRILESTTTSPQPRGWFDADVTKEGKVVVSGGLSETNERLNDVWVLLF